MANAVKGEIALKLSDGREFTIVGDIEATIIAEELYGKPAAEIAIDAAKGYMGAIRAMFFGMLKAHHPDATPALAAELLSGHLPEIEEAMNKANSAAAPKPVEGGDSGKAPRARSTGKSSGNAGAK